MPARKSTTGKQPSQAAVTHATRRSHDSRVDETSDVRATHPEQPQGAWVRRSNLDAPEPRPGMVQRWIRRSLQGADDPGNWNGAMREGWRPRKPETATEDWQQFAIGAETDTGMIVVNDLVLCEMDAGIYQQRKAHYDSLRFRQIEGVEEELSGTHRSTDRHSGFHQIKNDSSSSTKYVKETVVADNES